MSACFHANNVTCDNCRGMRFNLTTPSGVSSDNITLVVGEGLRFRPEDALRITDESVLALRQKLSEVERERDEARGIEAALLEQRETLREHLARADERWTEVKEERDRWKKLVIQVRDWAAERGDIGQGFVNTVDEMLKDEP